MDHTHVPVTVDIMGMEQIVLISMNVTTQLLHVMQMPRAITQMDYITVNASVVMMEMERTVLIAMNVSLMELVVI
jgi:hypothetical protein